MTRALLLLACAAAAVAWSRREGTWTVSVSHYRGAGDEDAPEPAPDLREPWLVPPMPGPEDGVQPADPVTMRFTPVRELDHDPDWPPVTNTWKPDPYLASQPIGGM